MKTILVTGANGQLGNSIRRLAAGYPQYAFVFTKLGRGGTYGWGEGDPCFYRLCV